MITINEQIVADFAGWVRNTTGRRFPKRRLVMALNAVLAEGADDATENRQAPSRMTANECADFLTGAMT